MQRAALVLLLSLIGLPRFADASERTLRGRVVDAEGHGVAAIDVATSWTIGTGGAKPRRGTTTDAEGRFALSCSNADSPVVVVAYDASRARGAFVAIASKALASETSISLAATVEVTGKLSTEQGKYYPASGVCFIALAAERSFSLRVEPENGKFSIPLPPGAYVLSAGAPARATQTVDVVVAAGKPGIALATIDLKTRESGVEVGDLAPPIRLRVGHPMLDAALAASHFPDRWTLFYFWDVT